MFISPASIYATFFIKVGGKVRGKSGEKSYSRLDKEVGYMKRLEPQMRN